MAGPYATAVSELVVAPHLKAGLLAQACFDLPARSFSMLRHAERHRSRAAAAFEELARMQMAPASVPMIEG
jgi:DNA-binding transcriptional LysR family regulator